MLFLIWNYHAERSFYTYAGVFGGLDIHGLEKEVRWTRLAVTAEAGDRQIKLAEPVDWLLGDQLVIATTSYRVSETEVGMIESVSDDRRILTLISPLTYTHAGMQNRLKSGKPG